MTFFNLKARFENYDSTFLTVFFIYLFSAISGSILWIYSDSLFLITYPSEWIAYLFFIESPLRILIVYLTNQLLLRTRVDVNKLFIFLFILIISTTPVLFYVNLFWLPFFYILLYHIMSGLLSFVRYRTAVMAFSLQELKKYSVKFESMATLGSILACFSLPFLLKYISLNSVTFIMVGTLVIVLALLFKLPKAKVLDKLEEQRATQKRGSSTFNYPLAINVFFISVVTGVVNIFVDYSFKNEIAHYVDHATIPKLIGISGGIISLVTFIYQLFFLNATIKNYGVPALLSMIPVVLLFVSVLFFIYPSLNASIAYYIIGFVCIRGLNPFSINLLLKALPNQIGISAKLFSSETFNPIGLTVASFFLIFFPMMLPGSLEWRLSILALLTALICFIWFLWTRKVNSNYQKVLEEGIASRFFSSDVASNLSKSLSQDWIEKTTLNILKQSNEKLDYLAFYFLSLTPNISKEIKTLLFSKLKTSDTEHQVKIIHILEHKGGIPTGKLLELLDQEENQDTIWTLVKILHTRKDQGKFTLASEWIKKNTYKKIYGYFLLTALESAPDVKKAHAMLLSSSIDKLPSIRLACAQVYGELKHCDMSLQLEHLLKDSDLAVSSQAQKATAHQHLTSLLPTLVSCLEKRKGLYSTSKAIQSFGEASVPHLVSVVEKQRTAPSHLAIKTLSFIEGKSAEDALLALANHPSVLTKTMIAQCSLDAKETVTRSPEFFEGVHRLILEEFEHTNFLKGAKSAQFPSYIDKEIDVQLRLASIRFLSWYSLFVGTTEAKSVISLIINMNNKNDRDKALEILINLAKESDLKKAIFLWNEPNTRGFSQEEIVTNPFCNSDLKKLILMNDNKEHSVDDDMNKILTLREVAIFATLPVEVLYAVANVIQWKEMYKEEVLFSEGEISDGFYVIASGQVSIQKKGKEVDLLKENNFFGEAGILSNEFRLASAIAKTDGMLLYMDNNTFNDLSLDFPEILRPIAQFLISYLRKENVG